MTNCREHSSICFRWRVQRTATITDRRSNVIVVTSCNTFRLMPKVSRSSHNQDNYLPSFSDLVINDYDYYRHYQRLASAIRISLHSRSSLMARETEHGKEVVRTRRLIRHLYNGYWYGRSFELSRGLRRMRKVEFSMKPIGDLHSRN